MGQKVSPIGLRLGINKTWFSRWFVDPKLYAATLHEDLRLRKTILNAEETKGADIAEVEIIRHPQRVTVIIHTGRPGVLIGAKGANIEKLGGMLQKLIGKKIQLRIKEIKRPEMNAKLVAENISRQIKARASYRRACKMAIMNSMKTGVQGIKVKISGRRPARRSPAARSSRRAASPCTPSAPTSTTPRPPRSPPSAASASRSGSSTAKCTASEKKDDAGLLVRRGREGRDDRDGRDGATTAAATRRQDSGVASMLDRSGRSTASSSGAA